MLVSSFHKNYTVVLLALLIIWPFMVVQFKVDSVFHAFKFNQMSTRNSWGLVCKELTLWKLFYSLGIFEPHQLEGANIFFLFFDSQWVEWLYLLQLGFSMAVFIVGSIKLCWKWPGGVLRYFLIFFIFLFIIIMQWTNLEAVVLSYFLDFKIDN